jgi:hypothetical protein
MWCSFELYQSYVCLRTYAPRKILKMAHSLSIASARFSVSVVITLDIFITTIKS